VEDAVQIYGRGNLNPVPSFGVDPLEGDPAKKEARQSIKYFPSYDSMIN